jgi:hypothetical protein
MPDRSDPGLGYEIGGYTGEMNVVDVQQTAVL